MPLFTYVGDEGRYYPQLGLAPDAGQDYELEADPDDTRWLAVKAKASTPAKSTKATADQETPE